jgi:hypothetical protein
VNGIGPKRQRRKKKQEEGKRRHHRLGQIHVPHRLVITPQRRLPLRRRDEAKRTGLRLAIVRPRAAEKLALPFHDPVAEVVLVDGLARGRVLCQGRCVRVMAGEPVRRRFPGRPVVFRVKDRRLLPEAPLHLQGNNFATPVRKRLGQDIGHPRPNRVTADRLLVGERAEFQFHRAPEVIQSRRLRRGVVKKEYRRVRVGIRQGLEPRSLALS